MRRNLSEQFDMTPGWRKPPRPGVEQQGKLFHGGPKTGLPERYPRGYTPERQAQISGMLSDVEIPPTHEPTLEHHPFIPQGMAATGGQPYQHESHMAKKKAATRAVVDALARSTIPASDLSTASGVGSVNIRIEEPHPSRGGSYKASEGRIRLNAPATAPAESDAYAKTYGHNYPGEYGDSKYQAEATLLHELGHHVSHHVQETEHSEYRTPEQKGREEGYADAYMATHQRRHPKDPRPEASPRAYNFSNEDTFGDIFDREKSRSSYRTALPQHMAAMGATAPAPGSPEAKQAWREHEQPENYLRDPMDYQPHLFGRNANKEVTDVTPDFGQFGYRNFTQERETPLGTLNTCRVTH